MLIQLLLLLTSLALGVPRPYVTTEDTTPALDRRQSSSYWMETITRQGQAAYNSDKSYKIFRNVRDYGAVGDGTTDDSAAINKAIQEGNRCGNGDCDSSTITPAIVYFPAGTYKISNPLIMYYYTQMIGDAHSMPRIQGAADFNFEGNLALLDADPYIPNANGAGWYTNQNNFYRQMRNLVIDMTLMPEVGPNGQEVNGVHWQVSQACSMQNVVFDMKPATPTSKQRGIMMENGSGMFMSDIVFNGGNVGAFLGSQQFTTRNFTFNGCNTAIEVPWNFVWTFKSVNIQNCQLGVNISSTNSVNETVGATIIMDSKIQNTDVGISTSRSANSSPEAGNTFLIHNVDFSGTSVAVQDSKTENTLLDGNVIVASWGQGHAYIPSGSSQPAKRDPQGVDFGSSMAADATCSDVVSTTTVLVSPLPATASTTTPVGTISGRPTSSSNSTLPRPNNGTATIAAAQCTSSGVIPTQTKIQQQMNPAPLPSSLLAADGSVFERSKPQYIDVPKEQFISVKSFGATGDGVTDDSDSIQNAMDSVTSDQIVYFDHGAYVITKTINVPSNIRIVGEIWPMIMISGEFFSDQNNPQPGFRVGNPGDSGNVEISDMMFETKGPAPGAIMMQWNVQETSQGSCGMWDTHFRVGGSAGTDQQLKDCAATTSQEFRPQCAASFMMMHVSQQASAYFENMWFWVADHDLDMVRQFPAPPANETQISIFNGRGVFIESQGPVWLWGTSSEHSSLYNYQIANAKNVFIAGLQTETAYYQGSPGALLSGFTPNTAFSDPDFADCTDGNCEKTWGMRILDSSDVYMFGGGLYSFFEGYSQVCTETESCQTNMVELRCSSNVFLYGLVTKATTNQVVVDGKPAVLGSDNPNIFGATVLLYQQQ